MKDINETLVDDFKVKTLSVFTGVLCFMGFLHSFLAFQYLNSNISGYCLLITSTLALFTPLIQRVGYIFAANYITAMLFIALCVVANVTEKISSAAAWWFPSVSIAGFLLVNIRVGIGWFILTFIAIILTYLNDNQIVLLARINEFEGKDTTTIYFISLLCVTVVISFFGFLFEYIRTKSQQREKDLENLLLLERHQASLGIVAGGIAHEINNPLAITKGHIDIALKRAREEDWERLVTSLNKISEHTTRISKIIDTVKTLSYDYSHSNVLEPLYLLKIIKEVDERIDDLFGKVVYQFIYDEDCIVLNKKIYGSRQGIEQIVLNIVKNSIDATSTDVVLTFEAMVEANMIYFSITDNGPGVAESIRTRIFDPFFSTKDVGSGTGLGLSISKSFANTFGGDLILDKHHENGSRFVLTIPII